jgi:hypothetical protein
MQGKLLEESHAGVLSRHVCCDISKHSLLYDKINGKKTYSTCWQVGETVSLSGNR